MNNRDDEHSYLKRLADFLLFVRSASEDEMSKLTRGGRTDGFYRILSTHSTTLRGLIEQGELIKSYRLDRNFNFDLPSCEFVIVHQFYDSFSDLLTNSTDTNPDLTLKEFLGFEWKPQPSKKRRRAGRPKAERNLATGKITGINTYAEQVIKLWEADKDVDSIRFELHPKTKTPPKRSAEIGKIKRILRRYRYLLKRSYDTK